MPSSYSSNITGNLNVSNITNSGARLLMTKALSGFSGGMAGNTGDDGVTAGDVVRFDVDKGKYVKSFAKGANQSEVIGVIEEITDDTVNIVLVGQMVYPKAKLQNFDDRGIDQDGGSGGNDVYFLSGSTAGRLSNVAPTQATYVAKPVLQIADDDVFNANVVNYIGYQIGGQAVAEDLDEEPSGAVNTILDFGGTTLLESSGWFDLSQENNMPIDSDDPYYDSRNGNTYKKAYENDFNLGTQFGYNILVTLSTTPDPDDLDKVAVQKSTNFNVSGSPTSPVSFKGIIKNVDIGRNQILIGTNGDLDGDGIKLQSGLYVGTKTKYVISSLKVTSFRLPQQINTSRISSYKDMFGNTKSLARKTVMKLIRDSGWKGVSISQALEIKNLNVTGDITVTSADGNTTITGIAKTLSDFNKDLNQFSDKGWITRESNTTISEG